MDSLRKNFNKNSSNKYIQPKSNVKKVKNKGNRSIIMMKLMKLETNKPKLILSMIKEKGKGSITTNKLEKYNLKLILSMIKQKGN